MPGFSGVQIGKLIPGFVRNVYSAFESNIALLEPYLPRGTELDLFNDTAYLSVVGLLFQNCRVLGIPLPGHGSFAQINVRFYARREGPEGRRAGVVFVRETVPKALLSWGGRAFSGQPFLTLPTRHRIHFELDDPSWVSGLHHGRDQRPK